MLVTVITVPTHSNKLSLKLAWLIMDITNGLIFCNLLHFPPLLQKQINLKAPLLLYDMYLLFKLFFLLFITRKGHNFYLKIP